MGTPIITELGKYLVKVNNEGTKTMSTGIQYLFMQKIRFNHYLIHFILSQYSISIPPENASKPPEVVPHLVPHLTWGIEMEHWAKAS